MNQPLDESVQQAVYYQSYAPQPAIEGVEVRPLRKHRAPEGAFMEYVRLDEAGRIEGETNPLHARQISVSWAEAGRINAFHLHPKRPQNERWTVVSGLLRVWLIDARQDSPTRGHKRQVILTGEQPAVLHIPAGVAHGYQAGAAGAVLIYAVDSQFDLADPNEGRLPWDYFGAELWEPDRG